MKKTLLNHLWKMKAYIFSMFIFAFLFSFSTLQTNAANNDFEVTVKNISPSGSENAQLQFTVTNKGNNFEGTARLMTMEDYSAVTAFDEDLSLPNEGTKQFVYTIPADYLDEVSASYFELIDRKGKTVFGSDYSRYLFNSASVLSVGILSDNYNNLTFFDLTGKSIGYGNSNYHVTTIEITKATLRNEISALTFLVIDDYHTSALSDDDMALIWEWVAKGGCLIIGTGSKADIVYNDNMALLAGVSISINQPYYGANFGELPAVEFNVNGSNSYFFDNMDYLGCMVRSEGDGSITLSHYAFTDFNGLTEAELNGWTLNDLIEDILWNSVNYSKLANQMFHADYHRDAESMFFPILNAKDNKLSFIVVKIVIILYLIVISPFLYLFLKKKGKQELYWVAIPVLCLAFILLVFLSGNGLTVRKTMIYSVTMADASGHNASKGALYCYDSHKKEWHLPLKNTVSIVAPSGDQYYDHNGSTLKDATYDYHIGHSQGELFIGLRPTQPFDEAYFTYSGENQENGEITYNDGLIQNNTGKDFAYVCVMRKSPYQSDFAIYENLAAGETLDMINVNSLAKETFSDDPSYALRNKMSDLFAPNYYNHQKAYDSPHAPALPALSYGVTSIFQSCPEDCIVVMGVAENYYPTVNENSNEKSYGCIYSVFAQNMGGTYAIY